MSTGPPAQHEGPRRPSLSGDGAYAAHSPAPELPPYTLIWCTAQRHLGMRSAAGLTCVVGAQLAASHQGLVKRVWTVRRGPRPCRLRGTVRGGASRVGCPRCMARTTGRGAPQAWCAGSVGLPVAAGQHRPSSTRVTWRCHWLYMHPMRGGYTLTACEVATHEPHLAGAVHRKCLRPLVSRPQCDLSHLAAASAAAVVKATGGLLLTRTFWQCALPVHHVQALGVVPSCFGGDGDGDGGSRRGGAGRSGGCCSDAGAYVSGELPL